MIMCVQFVRTEIKAMVFGPHRALSWGWVAKILLDPKSYSLNPQPCRVLRLGHWVVQLPDSGRL